MRNRIISVADVIREKAIGFEKGVELFLHILKTTRGRRETFGIDLDKVGQMDVAFAKCGLAVPALAMRKERNFYLFNLGSPGIKSNIKAAAERIGQALTIWSDNGHIEIAGPELPGLEERALAFVVTNSEVTSGQLSEELSVSASRASSLLARLSRGAYICREENPRKGGGGIRYVYSPIGYKMRAFQGMLNGLPGSVIGYTIPPSGNGFHKYSSVRCDDALSVSDRNGEELISVAITKKEALDILSAAQDMISECTARVNELPHLPEKIAGMSVTTGVAAYELRHALRNVGLADNEATQRRMP